MRYYCEPTPKVFVWPTSEHAPEHVLGRALLEGSLAQSLALEFSNRCEDPKHHSTAGYCRVDAISSGDEIDAQRAEFVRQIDEMPQASAKSIELEAENHVKLPSADVRQHLVKHRSAILRARCAALHKPGGLPPPERHKPFELRPSVLGC